MGLAVFCHAPTLHAYYSCLLFHTNYEGRDVQMQRFSAIDSAASAAQCLLWALEDSWKDGTITACEMERIRRRALKVASTTSRAAFRQRVGLRFAKGGGIDRHLIVEFRQLIEAENEEATAAYEADAA